MSRSRSDSTMLLVVDMQEKLQPLIHDDRRLRAKAAALAEGARLLGVPIVVTEQYPKGLGRTVPELHAAVVAAGGALEKTSFSCASDPAVRARIDALHPADVLVAGVETHICILQTSLDLVERGYRVHVVHDAVGSRDPANKEAGLAKLARHGVEPSTVEMALFELLGDARHPQFKTVQALVK